LPQIDVQKRIVAAVDRQLSVLDTLKTEVTRGLTRASALRRAVLATAFEGKLVPQDPRDEPALALLERIAAERASSNDHKLIKARGPRRRKATA
jgi:type I restriction enzyme S subunit